MVTYPIQVRRETYRGSDARKRQKVFEHNMYASKLEHAINEMLLKQTAPIAMYNWHPISTETGVPYDVVAKLGMSIDGGHNGFTAWRHDLTQAQALELQRSNTSGTEP